MTPERLNQNLETAVKEHPLLRYLLDLGIVARAVAIAVVVALLLWLVVGAAVAAIGLLLAYFGLWYALAQLSYDRRRESRPASAG